MVSSEIVELTDLSRHLLPLPANLPFLAGFLARFSPRLAIKRIAGHLPRTR
jgi:hypothetical protein